MKWPKSVDMERKPQGGVLSSYFSHSTEKISPLKLGSPWECSPFHSSSSRCLPLATSAPDWTPPATDVTQGIRSFHRGMLFGCGGNPWTDTHTNGWKDRDTYTHTRDGRTDSIDTFMPKWDYFVLKAAPRLFHE